MNTYHYILKSKGVPKLDCPYCGAKKHWVRYVDTETGKVLPSQYGKCDNADKCGHHDRPPLESKCYFVPFQQIQNYNEKAYRIKANDKYHYLPKSQVFEISETGCYVSEFNLSDAKAPPYTAGDYKWFKVDGKVKVKHRKPQPQPEPTPVSFIDYEIYERSLKGYENNNLIKYLDTIFGIDKVNHLIDLYSIGTSSRYGGGTTVYWQIDSNDNIRAGKLIKYAENGHRIHGKNNWVHSILKLDNFNLKQCLFGEHILKHAPDATVCIVESEKTAIIAAAILPDKVWLATGGAENLSKDKMKVLRGRNVILFPDASKDGRIYNKWKQKADEFGFDCSDYLERYATDEQKAQGVDIADFLSKPDEVKPSSPQK